MVRAEPVEEQLAAYVSGMRLPPESLGEVVAELRRRQTVPHERGDADKLQREVERWRRLFVLGEIDEERYRRETRPLKQRLAELERPKEVLDVERALNYLRDMGALWAESPRHLHREFVREIFQRIIVKGREIAAITPKPSYC